MCKLKYFFIIVLIVGCKSQRIDGIYYSHYGWHSGSGKLIKINSDSSFKYVGNIAGHWDRKGNTLYLYSSHFFHQKNYNQSIVSFLDRGFDTLTAIDKSTATNKFSHQITENDSVDIFLIKKRRLYVVTPGKGTEAGYYLQKIRDTADLRFYIYGRNLDDNLNHRK